jgi:hypothetical protein
VHLLVDYFNFYVLREITGKWGKNGGALTWAGSRASIFSPCTTFWQASWTKGRALVSVRGTHPLAQSAQMRGCGAYAGHNVRGHGIYNNPHNQGEPGCTFLVGGEYSSAHENILVHQFGTSRK